MAKVKSTLLWIFTVIILSAISAAIIVNFCPYEEVKVQNIIVSK